MAMHYHRVFLRLDAYQKISCVISHQLRLRTIVNAPSSAAKLAGYQ
jgi:hypothetical protein